MQVLSYKFSRKRKPQKRWQPRQAKNWKVKPLLPKRRKSQVLCFLRHRRKRKLKNNTMKHSFTNIENALSKFLPWVWEFIKWTFYLLIVESFQDLWDIAKERWKNATALPQKMAVILTSWLITSFLLYWVYWLWNDYYNWRTREWRERISISQSQQEVEDFFRKYNQEFIAHNCDFMATVWADESMHDKWWHDKYENYRCEEFVTYQSKMIIPINIEPIISTWDKLHARGRAIVVTENQWEPLWIKAMYFDLWKVNTWGLWHFNNPKWWPRIIDAEIRYDN